jgi:hypothetical protein
MSNKARGITPARRFSCPKGSGSGINKGDHEGKQKRPGRKDEATEASQERGLQTAWFALTKHLQTANNVLKAEDPGKILSPC